MLSTILSVILLWEKHVFQANNWRPGNKKQLEDRAAYARYGSDIKQTPGLQQNQSSSFSKVMHLCKCWNSILIQGHDLQSLVNHVCTMKPESGQILIHDIYRKSVCFVRTIPALKCRIFSFNTFTVKKLDFFSQWPVREDELVFSIKV